MLGQFEGRKIVTTTSYLAPIALEGEEVETRILKKSTLETHFCADFHPKKSS